MTGEAFNRQRLLQPGRAKGKSKQNSPSHPFLCVYVRLVKIFLRQKKHTYEKGKKFPLPLFLGGAICFLFIGDKDVR